MSKLEITKDTELHPGDKIELVFNIASSWNWLQAIQAAIYEYKIESKSTHRVESVWLDEEAGKYHIVVTILDYPPAYYTRQASSWTVAAWAVIIVGGGLLAWFNLDKVYKIVKEPAGKILAIGLGLLLIAIAFGKLRPGRA